MYFEAGEGMGVITEIQRQMPSADNTKFHKDEVRDRAGNGSQVSQVSQTPLRFSATVYARNLGRIYASFFFQKKTGSPVPPSDPWRMVLTQNTG